MRFITYLGYTFTVRGPRFGWHFITHLDYAPCYTFTVRGPRYDMHFITYLDHAPSYTFTVRGLRAPPKNCKLFFVPPLLGQALRQGHPALQPLFLAARRGKLPSRGLRGSGFLLDWAIITLKIRDYHTTGAIGGIVGGLFGIVFPIAHIGGERHGHGLRRG